MQHDFEQFFRSREVYEQYGIPWKRGALFIGPPGNGKTHTVKALINQLGRPCLYVKGFKTEYATEQENMGAVFARARMSAPCVMVLEDIDSMIDDENRSFFLNELDGFENNTGLVVLATTNHPDRLDPAILHRPSRFDRKYYFNLPAAPERLAYINAWNNSLVRTGSGPGSPSGQPAWGGGCDRVEATQVGLPRADGVLPLQRGCSAGDPGLALAGPQLPDFNQMSVGGALVKAETGNDLVSGNDQASRDAPLHPELRLSEIEAGNGRASRDAPLRAELHLSEMAVRELVQQTENFSFAYMKELFVSATMQWMSTRGEMSTRREMLGSTEASGSSKNGASMDEIILDQAVRLRAQMTALPGSTAASSASSFSAGTLARALAAARRFLRARD